MVRQTDREGKHVSSFGRSGKLIPIPPNAPNPPCPGTYVYLNRCQHGQFHLAYLQFRLIVIHLRSLHRLEENVNLLFCIMHFVQYLCSEL